MKDTIQALTVAMALLLYPAQFCTPHPENQSLLWFSWHRAPAGPAGKAWVMDQGGFDLLAAICAMTEMGTLHHPPAQLGMAFPAFPGSQAPLEPLPWGFSELCFGTSQELLLSPAPAGIPVRNSHQCQPA